jgi:hypothetical protein
MNSSGDIYYRLLNIFPVNVLKEYFNLSSLKKPTLIKEILKTVGEPEIINFAVNNLPYTKQHIYLYGIKSGKPNLNMPVLDAAPTTTNGHDGVSIATYFIETNSNVIVTDVLQRQVLTNYWPVTISYSSTVITIKITTMEHRTPEYNGVPLIDQGGRISEADLKTAIIAALIEQNMVFYPIDLNKGVKYMWENDRVDAKFARYRKANSVSSEVMNENYTLKKVDPVLYAEMLLAPLEKNIFKFEDAYDDDTLPTHFTVEPETGLVSFTLYAPSLDANQKVLNLILSNN